MEQEALKLFSAHAWRKEIPAGTEIFRQGGHLREVCLLESGLVRMTRLESNGDERPMEFRAAGKILGAASVLAKQPALMTATALMNCDLRILSTDTFQQLLESHAVLSQYLLETLSQQFYEQVVRYSQSQSLSARARVVSFLLQCVPESDLKKQSEIRLLLPDQHQMLAGFVGISPQYFSRILQQLERSGVIRREKGWIVVVDLNSLVHKPG